MIGTWLDIGPTDQIAPGNARTLPVRGGPDENREIAIFHTLDNQFYALVNKCPHKQGPLSQGIVHGNVVTCPLHNWNISLKSGEALGDDKGCTPTVPVKIDGGRVLICRASTLRAAA